MSKGNNFEGNRRLTTLYKLNTNWTLKFQGDFSQQLKKNKDSKNKDKSSSTNTISTNLFFPCS